MNICMLKIKRFITELLANVLVDTHTFIKLRHYKMWTIWYVYMYLKNIMLHLKVII